MPTKDFIRQRREAQGLSQTDVAIRLQPWWPGVEFQDISKIERGKRRVYADELPMFARVLMCQPNDLVDQEPTPKPPRKHRKRSRRRRNT